MSKGSSAAAETAAAERRSERITRVSLVFPDVGGRAEEKKYCEALPSGRNFAPPREKAASDRNWIEIGYYSVACAGRAYI